MTRLSHKEEWLPTRFQLKDKILEDHDVIQQCYMLKIKWNFKNSAFKLISYYLKRLYYLKIKQ